MANPPAQPEPSPNATPGRQVCCNVTNPVDLSQNPRGYREVRFPAFHWQLQDQAKIASDFFQIFSVMTWGYPAMLLIICAWTPVNADSLRGYDAAMTGTGWETSYAAAVRGLP